MTDYKEILRLHALGLSKQTIATSIGCSRNTVRSALAAAEANGVTWETAGVPATRCFARDFIPAARNVRNTGCRTMRRSTGRCRKAASH